MATKTRSADDVRRDIAQERERLAEAVESLRTGVGDAVDVRGKLPVLAAGALGAGFFLAGGIGATARLLFRRGREGKKKATVGRFTFIDRN